MYELFIASICIVLLLDHAMGSQSCSIQYDATGTTVVSIDCMNEFGIGLDGSLHDPDWETRYKASCITPNQNGRISTCTLPPLYKVKCSMIFTKLSAPEYKHYNDVYNNRTGLPWFLSRESSDVKTIITEVPFWKDSKDVLYHFVCEDEYENYVHALKFHRTSPPDPSWFVLDEIVLVAEDSDGNINLLALIVFLLCASGIGVFLVIAIVCGSKGTKKTDSKTNKTDTSTHHLPLYNSARGQFVANTPVSSIVKSVTKLISSPVQKRE